MYAARPSKIGLPRPGRRWSARGRSPTLARQDVQTDIANLRDGHARRRRGGGLHHRHLAEQPGACTTATSTTARARSTSSALADAMNEEYRAIVDAGFVVQIDDPWLATHYGRALDASVEECRASIAAGVEVVNYALRGIPEEMTRFHTCYSTNVAPRVHDLELKHFVDLMLQINVGGVLHRGRESRATSTSGSVWQGRRAARRQGAHPRRRLALRQRWSSIPSWSRSASSRFASVVGRERVIASQRLRLRHVGGRRRGAPGRRLGQARSAGRGRAARHAAALGPRVAARGSCYFLRGVRGIG